MSKEKKKHKKFKTVRLVYLFKYLSKANYMPGTVLSAGVTVINNPKTLSPRNSHFNRGTEAKQIHK